MVVWTMGPTNRPTPLSFQLEVSRAGHNLSDDWEVVQPFQPDIYIAVDPKHRAAGWFQRTYYRVAVKDATGNVTYSEPISANQGKLNDGQLRDYKEIVRREEKRNRLRNSPTTPGYLLKIKYYGDKCPECLDPDHGESTDDACPICFGVGYIRGYHPPFPCFNVDFGPMPQDLTLYQEQGPMVRGGIGGIAI